MLHFLHPRAKATQFDCTGFVCVTVSRLCAVDLLDSYHSYSGAKVAVWQITAHSLVFEELSQILVTVFHDYYQDDL